MRLVLCFCFCVWRFFFPHEKTAERERVEDCRQALCHVHWTQFFWRLWCVPSLSDGIFVDSQVEAHLPRDLKPAVIHAQSLAAHAESEGYELVDHGQDDANGGVKSDQPKEARRRARRIRVEGFRRDMRRAALGAKIASAIAQGPEWGSPDGRLLGTEEDNARRVATLAASEASRALAGGAGEEEVAVGTWEPDASGVAGSNRGRKPVDLPSGPAGGAREQRRAAEKSASQGGRRAVGPEE